MELQLTGYLFLPFLLGLPGKAESLIPKADDITKEKRFLAVGHSLQVCAGYSISSGLWASPRKTTWESRRTEAAASWSSPGVRASRCARPLNTLAKASRTETTSWVSTRSVSGEHQGLSQPDLGGAMSWGSTYSALAGETVGRATGTGCAAWENYLYLGICLPRGGGLWA